MKPTKDLFLTFAKANGYATLSRVFKTLENKYLMTFPCFP